MQVVFGANGRAGGETARALIERGLDVRIVLRRAEHAAAWRDTGVQIAIARMDNEDEVAAALEGATGAFLLNPPPSVGNPHEQTEKIGTALAEAARRMQLPRAVVLSSVGAQHASGTGVITTLNRLETLLDGAATATMFLRPGYFVESWSEVAEAAIIEGVLPTFMAPAQKIPMVSTIDVGRAAAQLLAEDWKGQRIVELGGPEDWSASDVAAAFARALGRPVTPTFVPPEQRAAMLAAAGVPKETADALLGMYDGIASGKVAFEPGVERRRGTVSLVAAVERILSARNSS
ncbi:NmrA family NAD(P)-binding protein [Oceanibaculum sp.]|uniref:NmrA family NAD(P)-binding protein n=1 Tax=Oceanibaculum sp. TaxID=1903597 RepID=UPI0025855004|nr:NmrA family NAD(P)-binding protein [Oceanibaculum sp.]MCH2396535.1 NmrA family NAD(P)-binding protein [Oceanibaculum sp.]